MSQTWTQSVSGTYTFPPPGGGTLSEYTITQIVVAGAGGGASILFFESAEYTDSGGNGANISASDFTNTLYTENSLQIYIGGGGTFTKTATNLLASSGSGGGSSSIVGANTGNTILVAGAGGGAGISDDGALSPGGDYEQQGGSPTVGAAGGGGGLNGTGGTGGTGTGEDGIAGSSGNGGAGGSSISNINGSLIVISGGTGNGGGNGGNGVSSFIGVNLYSLSGGGGGGYGGGGSGGADGTGFGAGGGGGGNFINSTYILTSTVQSANNAGTYFTVAGDGYVTITYTINSPPSAICLLPNCDVLLSNFSLKNITEITLADEVIGYLTKRPEKIKKVIKRTHFTNFLEDTNKPYLVEKSAFGPNVPDKDIHLSGHHRIITQTEDNHFVGVQAFKLENCKKVTNNPDEVTYYHILLENQGAGLIVNNLPVEDCIDD